MALFELDHFHEILQTMRRNRLRTFLTACGDVLGRVHAGGDARLRPRAGKGGRGGHRFFRHQQHRLSRGEHQQALRRAAGRAAGLARPSTTWRRSTGAGVQVAFGRNHKQGAIASRGERFLEALVIGDYPEGALTERSVVSHGRYLNAWDIKEARKVAVIGTKVRRCCSARQTRSGRPSGRATAPSRWWGCSTPPASARGPAARLLQQPYLRPRAGAGPLAGHG